MYQSYNSMDSIINLRVSKLVSVDAPVTYNASSRLAPSNQSSAASLDPRGSDSQLTLNQVISP